MFLLLSIFNFFKISSLLLLYHFIAYYNLSKKTLYLKQIPCILKLFCDWLCFVFFVLYFWESNLYSMFLIFLIFAFWYLLSILYLEESNHQHLFSFRDLITGLIALSPLTLPFLLHVTSISFPPFIFSTWRNLSACSWLWRAFWYLLSTLYL